MIMPILAQYKTLSYLSPCFFSHWACWKIIPASAARIPANKSSAGELMGEQADAEAPFIPN